MKIWTKSIVSLLLVLLIILSVSGWISMKKESMVFDELMKVHGQSLSHSIATFSIEVMLSEDYPMLDTFLETMGKENNDIIFIEIARNGKTISRYHSYDSAISESDIFYSDILFSIEQNKPGEKIGEVKLGLSNGKYKLISTARLHGIIITMVSTFAAIALMVTLLINRIIRKPIHRLVEGIQSVSKGDLSRQVEIDSKDEIGQLTILFNKMVDDLRRTTISKDYVDSIITNMMDSLIVVSQYGKIETVNKATLELLGYTEDVLLNRPINLILAHEPFSTETDFISFIKQYFGKVIERVYLSREGRKIPVLFSGSEMLDVNGNLKGIICIAIDITERKQIEDKLRFSDFAVDNNADATYWVKSDSKFAYANKAACRTLGYSYEEFTSMRVSDIAPDFSDEAWPAHWQEMKEATTHTFETHHKTKTGQVFPVEIQSTYLEYHGDEYVCAYARDITERKRVEQRIELINRLNVELLDYSMLDEKLTSITNSVVEIFNADFARIWVVKPGDQCESGCVHASTAVGVHVCQRRDVCLHLIASSGRYTHLDGKMHCRVPLGCYKIGRLAMGAEPKYLTNDVTHNPFIHDHNWARSLGLVSFGCYRLISADKEPIGVMALFSKNPISSDEDALLEGLANSSSTIIKTAIFEENARKSDQRFARMLEVSEEAIVSIDESQKIIIFNKSAERVFGYTAKEIMGKPIEILIPGSFRLNHKKNVENFGKSKMNSMRVSGWQYRLFGIRKNGEEFPVEISISKFKEAGKMIFTIVLNDITERIKMENEALKAQKLESVGVLAGGIAHDFNNILTAILGNTNLAEILLKFGNTDKALDAISTIEKATIRATDLTQQLLTFAKGGAPIKKTASISELIKESAGFALRGANIKPEFSIPDTLWAADVDEGQVNQVINNLIINAAQAMSKGGTVNIRAENITENYSKKVPLLKYGKYIKVSVKDHGIGIPQEHIGNIFDPYFTTKPTGNGLGLAASYSIIKNHGGLITVDSAVGVGTTFYIYLPASSNTIAEKKDVVEDKPVTGSGKILIMDDNDAIRDMGSQTLSFIGYKVECAVDGAEAIEMYKKGEESGKPFDVVIMDLTVPGGMGGEEAIGKLHEIYPKAKAIVSSGYSNDPIMADYEKYGFKGVICKPFEIKEMNGVLKRVING